MSNNPEYIKETEVVGAIEYQPKQRVVTPCGWGAKAGMARMWVAGNTV